MWLGLIFEDLFERLLAPGKNCDSYEKATAPPHEEPVQREENVVKTCKKKRNYSVLNGEGRIRSTVIFS